MTETIYQRMRREWALETRLSRLRNQREVMETLQLACQLLWGKDPEYSRAMGLLEQVARDAAITAEQIWQDAGGQVPGEDPT